MFENEGINPYDTLAWEISHRYRAKNSMGDMQLLIALIISTKIYRT